MYVKYGKRWFDLALTIPGFLLVSPFLGLIALIVRLRLGSPVLFEQIRPGLNEKSFPISKFRTMTDARDSNGKLLPDHMRITKLGHFLRKTSLDELPELINVLKGDMSLVGPRPLLQSYLPYYSQREQLRHTVRPGITGLAQISGRNYLDWNERLELDAKYVESASLALDLKILIKTFLAVFISEDVSVDSSAVEPSLITYKIQNASQKHD